MNTVANNSTGAGEIVAHSATINGRNYHFNETTPSVRQMLEKAEFLPADDCVLIHQLPRGTKSLGLDEVVDLKALEAHVFWAFKTDRVFRFTVQDHGYEWGAPVIKEPELRSISKVGEDEELYLERHGHAPHRLKPHDEIDFAKPGTEHIKVGKRLVEVFFKDLPYFLPPGVYSTEQLMQKFPIEPGYLLNLLTPQDELVTLKPGQHIEIKCGMKFYSQVPGGASS